VADYEQSMTFSDPPVRALETCEQALKVGRFKRVLADPQAMVVTAIKRPRFQVTTGTVTITIRWGGSVAEAMIHGRARRFALLPNPARRLVEDAVSAVHQVASASDGG
jgi:hypothetical protein